MDGKMESRPAGQGPTQQASERPKVQAAAQDVQGKAEQRADQGRERVARGAEDLARAGQRAADELAAQGEPNLADGLRYAADKLAGLAQGLHQRSATDLLHEAEALARRNPALFIGGSIALGLALSRMFKASASATPDRTGQGR